MVEYLDLIGIPFEYGGRGPDSYDCYGLVMELYRRRGIEIPDYRSPTDIHEISKIMKRERQKWKILEEPELGSVLLLKVQGLPCHVGMVVKPNRFIHTWQGISSVLTERISLWEKRIIGIYDYSN